MEYFCYISRSKVDQLYATIAPEEPGEWVEQRSSENTFGGNAQADWNVAKIITIFKGGLTYGRKGVLHREQKIKLHYVEKLRRVLCGIATRHAIPPLSDDIAECGGNSLYFHYEGVFTVTTPLTAADSSMVVTVRSKLPRSELLLDCSLRYFSEGNEGDGRFHLHSGNARFFSGEIPLRLETVMILLGTNAGKIFGSPLFLKMAATQTVPPVCL